MNFQYEKDRIYLMDEEGKLLAEIMFPAGPDGIAEINRTFVDTSLRGQGVAGLLMAEAVKKLAQENRQARCLCSYAVAWQEKHPEANDILIRS